MTKKRYSYHKSLLIGRKEEVSDYGQILSLSRVVDLLNQYELQIGDFLKYIERLEKEKISLQIKLQKIRDFAEEDGEVKQGVIEKVVMWNDY